MTHPTDDGRLEKILRWFRPPPPPPTGEAAAATPQDLAERKRAPEEFGGFIANVKTAHPTRQIIAVLCWLGRIEGGGSGDGSSGARTNDGGGSSGSHGSSADGSNGGSGDGAKRTKKQRLVETAQQAGVSFCVLDMPGLERLGIRMKA